MKHFDFADFSRMLKKTACNVNCSKKGHSSRGVARIFQRGGHRQGHLPGIAEYIWFISLLSLVYQRAQSYYRSMKAHIN